MIIIRVDGQYYKTEFVAPAHNETNKNYCKCVRWNWTKKKWAKTWRFVSFNEFELINNFTP